jgi:alkylmercury lyase
MPEATLAVRRSAFRSIRDGHPVPLSEVVDETGLPVAEARRAMGLIASVGMAELEDDTLVGVDGLTTRPTPHRINLNGVELWTWCAYDIVGISAALEADALGITLCGRCQQPLDIIIRKGRPERSTFVGWLPDETCTNVIAGFCPHALMFCSRSHLEEWRERNGIRSGSALDLEALASQGQGAWADLVV